MKKGLILFFAGLCGLASEVKSQTLPDSLEQMKSVQLEEVTVSSTRVGETSPIVNNSLYQQQIKQNNAAKNVPYILQVLPSVVAFSEDGAGTGNTSLRIRGVDATRINVTLNGMPLNNPESQEVYWVNLPDLSNSLQSLQLQRGAGTSTNGTASIGGSLSMNTVGAKNKAYGEITGSLGSYNTYSYTLAGGTGLLKNGLSFDARYSQVKSDGYIRNGKADHQSFYSVLSYYSAKDLLRLSYLHGAQHTGITWEGIDSEKMKEDRRYNPAGEYVDDNGDIQYYGNETDNYYSDIVQLTYSRFLSDKLSLNTNLNYNHGYGYYENYKTDRSFGSYYGLPDQTVNGVLYKKSDAVHRKLMKNDYYTATVSLAYTGERLNLSGGGMASCYNGDHYGRIRWVKYNENIPQNYEWYCNDAQKQDYNAFTKAEYQVSQLLSVFGDLQYRFVNYKMKGSDDDFADIANENNYNFFNPKIGLSTKLDPNGKLGNIYAYAAIVNREPLRADLKESIKGGGTQKITPERLFDYELGYKINKSEYSLNVNLYYMDYKDQMVQTGKLNDVGYKLMENVDRSYRYGLELSGACQPAEWVRLDANLTLSQNKIKDYTAYTDKIDENWNFIGQVSQHYAETDIAFSPDVVSSGVVTFKPLQNLNLAFVGKYVGKQYYDNTSDEERQLEDYFVANLVLSYSHKLKRFGELDFQLFVNNLFDKEYVANAWTETYEYTDGTREVYTGFYPQATRNFITKVSLRF
jgi:iron complex outermembrane receptor protein